MSLKSIFYSILFFSCNKASLIAWDSVEKRFVLILDSTHLKSSGSIETDRFTDNGPFFFGRTIKYDIVPKLINTSITITFLVVL